LTVAEGELTCGRGLGGLGGLEPTIDGLRRKPAAWKYTDRGEGARIVGAAPTQVLGPLSSVAGES
jgi:hypothetical protein